MMDEDILYSVVLLKESVISERKIEGDEKIFEESVILFKSNKNFFENKSQEELLLYFNKEIPPLEYINGYGEDLRNNVVYIIDYFKIMDSIKVDNFIEVYSRHLIEKIGTTVEDIIKKYYSDYSL